MIEFYCMWCTMCVFQTHQTRFCIDLNIIIEFSHWYCNNRKIIIPFYPNIQCNCTNVYILQPVMMKMRWWWTGSAVKRRMMCLCLTLDGDEAWWHGSLEEGCTRERERERERERVRVKRHVRGMKRRGRDEWVIRVWVVNAWREHDRAGEGVEPHSWLLRGGGAECDVTGCSVNCIGGDERLRKMRCECGVIECHAATRVENECTFNTGGSCLMSLDLNLWLHAR